MTISPKMAGFGLAPLTILMFTGCGQAPAQTDSVITATERPVQVMTLSDQQQSNIKLFSGVLEATQTAKLSFKVPGTIEAMLVRSGDRVTKGQVLARLDPHDYQVLVLELEGRLAEASAAHQLAAAELKRVKQAIADSAISAVNLDRAESGYKRSLAMVQVVTQNLQKAQDALSYTELKAPFSGVIGSQSQETFEQTSPGISLFSLHQPNKLKAVVDVPENLIGMLSVNQEATVSWYGGEKPISAVLTEMNTLADPIKQTYSVQFVLAKTSQQMSPGRAINVSVDLGGGQSRYCLPYAALAGEGAAQRVYLVKDQIIIEKPVQIEAMEKNAVCVSGDLAAGDAVVTAGVHFIKPQQHIAATSVNAFSY
ncbi:efflux RND transporter periplasmic adaptor subunit [Shewanella atlantica]|uniref:Efflux RND transporter periplasmic adaptor subunit n=1 Tax=Shewanella atlantica TaxID=271099 RepID=A0A431WBC8_9GAMM|nr:efflux RND transporter periplasmic adaptor subunit [Shewanella atlantica]RTR32707.1 efflux RND transporter periplasmic adaptor subunit [Shewanella atlantica]